MKNNFSRRPTLGKLNKHIDYSIIFAYIILTVIGLMMIYSASMVVAGRGGSTGYDPKFFFDRQLRFVILGFTIFTVMTFFSSTKLYKKTWVPVTLVFGSVLLLLITQIFGTEVNGEKNWFSIGFITIQASEFVKIVIIMYLAYVYDKRSRIKNGLLATDKKHLIPFLLVILIATWVAANDFGTGMIIYIIIICMFFYLDFPRRYSLPIFLGGIVFAGLIIFSFIAFRGSFLSDYQLSRINTFLHPFSDPYGEGYQLTNSLLAISNGGVFGKGLGNGVMKLGYLPEAQTDFIFATIAEEFGLLGVLFVLGLYFYIVFKAFYYSTRTTDLYLRLTTFGVGIYITIQCFFNIGGMSKALPLTGVPLPLLSYGGSSFLSISIALAILTISIKEIKYRQSINLD